VALFIYDVVVDGFGNVERVNGLARETGHGAWPLSTCTPGDLALVFL
jgi:hypothetical protein